MIYPVLLFFMARIFGNKIKPDESFTPRVGFVIAAYNEENVIQKKIDNILNIDYPAELLSIWIGSDCSADRTDDIVKSNNKPNIHLWRASKRSGKTGVINGLAPTVDAEILVMTDANTVHRPECLRAMVRNFADERVGVVAGHVEHLSSDNNNEEYGEGTYRSFESRQKLYEGYLHSTISAFGGFYAIRKKLFKPIPPNSYSNDDVLIPMNCIRQGYRVIYEPEAVSEEDFTGNVVSEFSRRVRIGAGNFQAFFWLLDFLNPLRGWPFFCYFSHKVTRWFSPLFLLSLIISCGVLAFFDVSKIYKMLFSIGTIISLSSLLYKIIPLRIVQNSFYFFAMNTALIMGLLRFFRGIKTAAWSRTERS
jgi:cellulose synthase/poly-beta-1,6-N-acetylglucosamine synthase-like glycosyltransferase